jgi:hypothetical protein
MDKHWILVVDGDPRPAMGLFKTRGGATLAKKRALAHPGFAHSAINVERWKIGPDFVWSKT